MRASVSEAAEAELVDGAKTYAEVAGKDLGLEFIAEFERCVDLLCQRPFLGMVAEEFVRRFPLRRFPYSIVYRVVGEDLRIVALAHHRRRPAYWAGRK